MTTENQTSCCTPVANEESCCSPLFTDREQSLIALAAAVALNNGTLAKQAIMAAKQVGLNNDEIGLISEVVSKMQGEEGVSIEEMATQSQSSSSTCCR